jgi:soluble lytic murein transglycosylase
MFILHCSIVYAEDIDGKALLKKGKEELDGKKYEDAIKSLSEAEKEFPLLGDYALLWLSEAYHETGSHAESLKTIRTLLKKYPDTPLRKKVRIKEIEEAGKISEENLQQIFESFIKDYPKDAEIKYAYAQWLKKHNIDIAKSIFKEICIDAGPFSDLACNEICPSDIQVTDLIEKASNLMKLMDFKGAESTLWSALEKDEGSLRNEILESLARSLFKQKKYLEAAGIYESINEKFWRVYSLYRAGGKESFNSALEELLKTGDKRAGTILVAVASDKRGDGETEEALKIYQNVVEQYPSEREDALWGIGWTYFLTGDYEKAADIFTKLYEEYRDTKYLYWKARSLEASGKDAQELYHTLQKNDRDFYSILSYIKTEGGLEKLNDCEIPKSLKDAISVRGPLSTAPKIDRVEVLFELGLSKEALLELIHISKTINSIDDLLYIGSKFQDLGEYKYIVNLTERLPYMDRLYYLCYPRAYWDTVKVTAQKHGVDPLFILSVMREESMFDPEARSTAGAIGLMQLMPQTAFRLDSNLQLRINNISQISDIKNNIQLGTYYLSTLIKEFGSYIYALAAYNAGEEKVKKWVQKGTYKSVDEFIEDIPYSETKNYVKRVMVAFFEYKRSPIEEEGIKSSPVQLRAIQ